MTPHPASGPQPPNWQPPHRSFGEPAGSAPPLLERWGGRFAATHSPFWCRPSHWLDGGAVCGADLLAQDDPLLGVGPAQGASWLLHEAFRQASLCETALHFCLPLPLRLRCDAALVRHAEAALRYWTPEHGAVELLLSEPEVAQAGADMLLALSALRDLGLGLALECGRGATGLARLRRLPLTCVRLTAETVCDLPHSRLARLAVAQTVGEAEALGASVLGPCVATAAQRDILADLGCDKAQGALFGLPMPATSFQAALLREAPA